MVVHAQSVVGGPMAKVRGVKRPLRACMMKYATLRLWGLALGCSHEHIRDFMNAPKKHAPLLIQVKAILRITMLAEQAGFLRFKA